MSYDKVQELIDYYSNLLILQYAGKPKMRATVAALMKVLIPRNEETGNYLLDDIIYGYNIETAVGKQLDVIGQYVGLARFYKNINYEPGIYFSFATYTDIDLNPEKAGFTTYSTFDLDEGEFLNYGLISVITNLIDDSDYRFLLKLRIVQNHINHSYKSLVDQIFNFFGTNLIVESSLKMSLYYFYNPAVEDIVSLALLKGILPRPIGVGLNSIIIQVTGGYFGFATYDREDYADVLINGFTTYDDFWTKEGALLNYPSLVS